MPRILLAAIAVLLACPAAAAAGVRMEARDESIPAATPNLSARRLPVREAPIRFNLVGVHWSGAGRVLFRTAAATGAWSAWQAARPEGEDAPDSASPEGAAARGWKLGNPYWTGPARRIQYRTIGQVARIRAFFLWSPVEAAPRALARPTRPSIVLRRAWGANESIVRARPEYADRIAFAVVHHTAGGQPSSPAQSAAIVRGIQAYHVQGNGWNDIGYNFLVDRYGQVFEGRGGGVTRNVVGAHAQGFNTGSVGVAVIGTYSGSGITTAARSALASVLAWRLDLAHVNPLSRLTWRSGGNPRFPTGQPVSIRAVSGHRATGYTTCPGSVLYTELPAIARLARGRGLPKIYAPRVTGSLAAGAVRFRATVDPARSWTVTVTNALGAQVASGRGSGPALDWTWDPAGVPRGVYRWTIGAGTARPATGRVGSGAPPSPPEPPAVTAAAVSPTVLSPNGDGFHDSARITFGNTARAELRVTVRRADGYVVAKVSRWRPYPAGRHAVTWAGNRLDGVPVPDGAYTLRIEARTATEQAQAELPVIVDRTLGGVSVRPAAFSPNGDRRLDATSAAFELARASDVVVRILAGAKPVATVFAGSLPAGPQSVAWNGRAEGTPVADRRYRLIVAATTALGRRSIVRHLRVDTARPIVSGVTAAHRGRGVRVQFSLSEPGRTLVWFGAHAVGLDGVAGTNSLWRKLSSDRVRVRTWDPAGNVSRLHGVGVS